MSTTIPPSTPVPDPLTQSERLELANQLYREFHTRCFWHSPRDLMITEEMTPFVVKGLRAHGGRRGFILAAKLQSKEVPQPAAERELPECR
jgi:hypothetical protein